MEDCTLFWFRRDLRLTDNVGLHEALQSGKPVLALFIFDQEILDELPSQDRRVNFIHQEIKRLSEELKKYGSSLLVFHGQPMEILKEVCRTHPVKAVYTNHDYEPYARDRDGAIRELLNKEGIVFRTFRDQVIFEKEEILTGAGKPYTVFTPYSKKWKAQLTQARIKEHPIAQHADRFAKLPPQSIPSLAEMGFEPSEGSFPGRIPDTEIIDSYHQTRDFPAKRGTSRLGLHLRFGTISIRQLVLEAIAHNETYLNELIWREFYMQILWNFPHVVHAPFRPEYAEIPWLNKKEDFEKWKAGKTGYPMVDAGMRELNATGYMHNRVRMVVASFLCKHLLINWQWGEAYFAEKLLDFELSSNNGGWQWAAGCGTDAAPYFRIFNPESQLKKFDPRLEYVRQWVPEYGTPLYPRPMVEHKMARERCLRVYKEALALAKQK